jgi:hypothetical protein
MGNTMLINNFETLKHVGITPLTGEADKLCRRVLCDLNDQGHQTIVEYLGLPSDTQFRPAWNSGAGSILLEPAVIQGLAVVGILKHYPDLGVLIHHGEVIGTSRPPWTYPPTDELRNRHQMSGRIV